MISFRYGNRFHILHSVYCISITTIQPNKRTQCYYCEHLLVWIVITEIADIYRYRTTLYFLRLISDIFQITENMKGIYLVHGRTTGEEVPIAPTEYITKSTDRLLRS
jgi:hypothetical protein